MDNKFFIVLILVFVLLLFFAIIIDSKKKYTKEDIVSRLITRENGQQYIQISTFIWQINKIKKIRELYKQNSIYTSNGFNYTITSCLKEGISTFITYDFEYGVQPYIKFEASVLEHIIIFNGGENITINFNNVINYYEMYSEIINSVSNECDSKQLLEYIEDISNNVPFDRRNVDDFYKLLQKYEPIISFATNIISILASIISYSFRR